MYLFLRTTRILILLLASTIYTKAQKNIVISDSLTANADELIATPTKGLRKWTIRFGDYHVITSKTGWGSGATKGKLFSTKSENNSKEKFSFVMCNQRGDTAIVNAAHFTKTVWRDEIKISTHFSLGSYKELYSSRNFTALITINGDTTDTWALQMNTEMKKDTLTKWEEHLTNGDRELLLKLVTSNKNNDDKRMVPAYGYEFSENGQPLCAIQYYGGGLAGGNRITVWIDRRSDSKTKLVLAAAMSAVLKLRDSDL